MLLHLIYFILFIYKTQSCSTQQDCYENGECINSKCICNIGFEGINCEYVNVSSLVNITAETTFLTSQYVSSWGGSPIQDDNGIIGHLISESNTPLGPYKLNDIAIDTSNNQSQINNNWDGLSVYNPYIIRSNDQNKNYLLFYTATSVINATHQDCTSNAIVGKNVGGSPEEYNQRIGIAYSKSLNGPWIKYENNPVITPNVSNSNNWNSNFTANPAPLQLKNGSVVVIYKARSTANLGAMYNGLAISYNGWKGPYITKTNKPLSIPTNCEDAYLWQQNQSYHLLFHCGCNYLHMYSNDLINWNKNFSQHDWCSVNMTNGGKYKFKRRERPSIVYDEKQNMKYLFTACQGENGKYFNFVQSL
eukprot:442698_1